MAILPIWEIMKHVHLAIAKISWKDKHVNGTLPKISKKWFLFYDRHSIIDAIGCFRNDCGEMRFSSFWTLWAYSALYKCAGHINSNHGYCASPVLVPSIFSFNILSKGICNIFPYSSSAPLHSSTLLEWVNN